MRESSQQLKVRYESMFQDISAQVNRINEAASEYRKTAPLKIPQIIRAHGQLDWIGVPGGDE